MHTLLLVQFRVASANNNLTSLNAFEIECSLHICVQEVQNCQERKHDTLAWEEKTHLLCMVLWSKNDKSQTEKGN